MTWLGYTKKKKIRINGIDIEHYLKEIFSFLNFLDIQWICKNFYTNLCLGYINTCKAFTIVWQHNFLIKFFCSFMVEPIPLEGNLFIPISFFFFFIITNNLIREEMCVYLCVHLCECECVTGAKIIIISRVLFLN